MQNQIISLETAKFAKEKGFKEFEQLWYNSEGQIKEIEFPGDEGLSDYMKLSTTFEGEIMDYEDEYYFASTQSLLQKWLREVHNIHVQVQLTFLGSDEWEFSYIIHYLPKEFEAYKRRAPHFETIESFSCSGGATYIGAWATYEECLENALLKALKLIKCQD